MTSPSETFDPKSFGSYDVPKLGATTFWSANYVGLESYVVVEVPLPIMKYVLEKRTRNGIEPFTSWHSNQQNTVIRGMLGGPKNPLPLADGGYRDGQFGFTNGRHRVAAFVHFEAPIVPLEIGRSGASDFVAEFGLAPPRKSEDFLGAKQPFAHRILSGFPPGLAQADEATIADDYRTIETYRKLTAMEAGSHVAMINLAKQRPSLIRDHENHEWRRAGIAERQVFLDAWQTHLSREIKSGNEAKPSILPFDWKKLPPASSPSSLQIRPSAQLNQ